LTTCLLVQRMVAELGFVCELASNGEEATRAVSASNFDVVLMDIFMPVMDGLHASIAIRSFYTESAGPAIYGLISGEEEVMRRQCIDAGMYDVLMKPISRPALRGILNRSIVPRSSTNTMDLRVGATKTGGSSEPQQHHADQDAATSSTRQPLHRVQEPHNEPTCAPVKSFRTCPGSAPTPTPPTPTADARRPTARPLSPAPPLAAHLARALLAGQLLRAAIAAALALCALATEALCAAAARGLAPLARAAGAGAAQALPRRASAAPRRSAPPPSVPLPTNEAC
jgi:CheY-like chemotaxis protein